MARVVRFHAIGGPEVLVLDDIEVRAPGEGEVRIAVEAIGLNRSDAMLRAGQHPTVPVLPSKLGQEAAGRIESLGPGVTGVQVGDAVNVLPRMSPEFGTMGELIIVPARFVIRQPDGITAIEAAALWAPFLTAYGCLVMTGNVQPGDHVVLTAASSSVGLAAIQLVNLLGAIPIALTRDRAKAPQLLAAGARHVIATEDGDTQARIRAATGGTGAQLVLDAVAGPGIDDLTGAMAHRGCYVLYGLLSGAPTPLPVAAIFAHLLTIRTFVLDPTIVDLGPALAFIEMNVAAGRLHPAVDKTFSIETVEESFQYLESNQQFGKIVVTV